MNKGMVNMPKVSRWSGFLLLIFLSVALLLAGCAGAGQAAQGQATATPLPPVKADNRIVADGRVIPVRSAELSFSATGIVAEILATEGDVVTSGQLLAKLSGARQQATVAQAEADVRRAQARLAEVKVGARVQEIAAAQASVDAAQARLDTLKSGSRPEEVAAAQANLAAAQAALQQAQAGPSRDQLVAAKAELANAEAAVRQAQALYDRVAGNPDIGTRPEALQLERATNEHNAAKARYDELAKGASAADIASARAQVDRARADLDAVKAPARPSDIAGAEAEVRRTQAQLDLLLAGSTPEQLAAAEADVAAAQAALALAQAALAETELRAPFPGTVAAIDAVIGQQIGPGVTAVSLGDYASWLVETSDLTELQVVGLLEGDRATISLDALPGLQLAGRVTRIKSIGENRLGDITYAVIVTPDQLDGRLRWNMSASITVEPGSGITVP